MHENGNKDRTVKPYIIEIGKQQQSMCECDTYVIHIVLVHLIYHIVGKL